MGVAITDLLVMHERTLEDFRGKLVVVDASMWLHQFLSSIRAPDGTPLMNSKGQVTSHLVGLSGRVPKILMAEIRPVFVFDGKPPALKDRERERRRGLKEEASAQYKIAVQEGDVESMRKFASRTSALTSQIITDAKNFLDALGIPYVQAPMEADAQCAHMVKNGDAFAVATNDADALLFGAPRIIRNLSLVGKRKKANKLSFETILPEEILLSENLNQLDISHDQLLALAMLVGTDYNYGGIKGIGPKNALKLVKKFPDPKELFKDVQWDSHFSTSWEEIISTFKTMPVITEYNLKRKPLDPDRLRNLLIDTYEFSSDRIEKMITDLQVKKQKSLADF
jgi:flap endonuclease-1